MEHRRRVTRTIFYFFSIHNESQATTSTQLLSITSILKGFHIHLIPSIILHITYNDLSHTIKIVGDRHDKRNILGEPLPLFLFLLYRLVG